MTDTDQLNTIIVADDDGAIRTVLNHALTRAGYRVLLAENAAALWQLMLAGEGGLVISDVMMPDENVFDVIPRIKTLRPDLPIIVMSAQNTFMTAVQANEAGAYEYLPKPFDLNELLQVVERALAMKAQKLRIHEGDDSSEQMPLIGRSQAMQDVYRVIARMMSSDLTVLITGESGTGKELIARALHDFGRRSKAPFVAVNMAAIPRDLIESELFGHEKGAFTGAFQRASGRFEQAEGGTLFLDEIGDMPMEAQTRLLRVLQQGEYTSVGGHKIMKTNVRIVAATNQNLPQLMGRNLFREDLYYRLNVVPLKVPSLRERREDIPDLIQHFFRLGRAQNIEEKLISAKAMLLLQKHSWPGNVRELENLVRRLGVLYPQNEIGEDVIQSELQSRLADHAHHAFTDDAGEVNFPALLEQHMNALFDDGLPEGGLYQRVVDEVERPLIAACLTATRGNQIKAADVLGLNRNTLRKKIRDLGIDIYRESGGEAV
ncbi:nitrogen regulation protein NR(I) [Brucellaceae bacterium C25G]